MAWWRRCRSVALTRVLAAAWPAPETGGLHTPARVAERLNAEFPVNNEVWQYFTFLGGVLDLSSLTLRYVSAGHPGPIHVPAGADPIALAAAGLPIGMFPDTEYTEYAARLEPGDRLYFYSDGVTEAMNPADDDFGVPGFDWVAGRVPQPTIGRDDPGGAPRGRPLARPRTTRRRLDAAGTGGCGIMSRSKRIVTVFTTLARWAVQNRRVSRRKTTDWVSRQAAVLVDAL